MWEGHDGERGVGDYDQKGIIGYNQTDKMIITIMLKLAKITILIILDQM